MRPAYPERLEIVESPRGFSITLETGEHFPRDEKQYHLAKTVEELVKFLLKTYGKEKK